MCGVCGVLSTKPLPFADIARSMMTEMMHRGPDAGGHHPVGLGEGVSGVLGFRRLAILDLSPTGNQPMEHPVTGDTLVFNGEIYNHAALRGEFETRGTVFRGSSDTEVLLEGLVRHGEAFLSRLHGMYAFAFHRARDGKLLLARDPLGIKPLYIARLPGTLVFGSEIRAVLSSGVVPTEVDAGGAASMLAYGSVQAPRTVWSHVRDFPAGHHEWIDGRKVREATGEGPKRFWAFAPTSEPVDPDVPGRVRDLLTSAVQSHVRADVPVGVFLSAGVDSTILATLAAQCTPKVTAFTVGFEKSLGEDEVAIASATAHDLGMKHVSVVVENESVFDTWRSWMASMDSPSIDGFNTALVSRAFSREGVVVGLSGLGADELFGGYGTLSRVRTLRLLIRRPLVPAIVHMADRLGVGGLVDRRSALEKLVDIVAGDDDPRGIYFGTRRVISNRWLAAFGLDRGSLGLNAAWLDRDADAIATPPDLDPFNILARLEATHYMRDTLLRDTDANSMRHSLEVRVPFLDLPLVGYVSSLPATAKTGPISGKRLLREACADILPAAVVHRKKTGFMLPVGAWMAGPMRDWCESSIDALVAREPFDGGAVRRLWRDFLADQRSVHWSRPLAIVVLGHHLASFRTVASA